MVGMLRAWNVGRGGDGGKKGCHEGTLDRCILARDR